MDKKRPNNRVLPRPWALALWLGYCLFVAVLFLLGAEAVSRWAASATTLEALREQVTARRATRATAERRARAIAHRHEVATRRALAGLRREVGR